MSVTELLRSCSSNAAGKTIDELRRQLPPEISDDSLAAGVIYLSHGHLELAHTISQTDKGPLGCYLHGLMHRLEPDLPNACYWFGRVGDDAIRDRIGALVTEQAADAAARIPGALKDGRFDPRAATEALMGKNASSLQAAVASCQDCEHQALLAACS